MSRLEFQFIMQGDLRGKVISGEMTRTILA